MGEKQIIPKRERIGEFIRRLEAAQPASDVAEALKLVCGTLNAVEDELTDIPYDLDRSDSDGRLYPPLQDSVREVEGHPNLRRYRNRAHNTFIGTNGAIEIRLIDETKPSLISKPGRDGRGVWEI